MKTGAAILLIAALFGLLLLVAMRFASRDRLRRSDDGVTPVPGDTGGGGPAENRGFWAALLGVGSDGGTDGGGGDGGDG